MKKLKIKDLFSYKFFQTIVLMLILLSYCYVGNIPGLSNILKVISLIISSFIIVMYILNFKFSKFILWFIMYILIGLLATYLGEDTSIVHYLYTYYRIMSVLMYLELGFKYNCKNTLNSLNIVLSLLLFLNLISIIIFPKGMYSNDIYDSNWFFGYKNIQIFYIFPTLIVSYLNNKTKKINKIFIWNLIISTFMVFHCFSANSVVVYCLFLIYIFFQNIITKKYLFFNIKNYVICHFVLFFMFIILKIQYLFDWLVVQILHKSLTFTGRTIIWDRVLVLIKRKPLLGYGFQTNEIVSNYLGNRAFVHAHNTILDIVYKGGLLTLLVFFKMIYYPIHELYTSRKNKLSSFISFILFCIFIMCIFEARQEKIGLYIILIISNNIKLIINSNN